MVGNRTRNWAIALLSCNSLLRWTLHTANVVERAPIESPRCGEMYGGVVDHDPFNIISDGDYLFPSPPTMTEASLSASYELTPNRQMPAIYTCVRSVHECIPSLMNVVNKSFLWFLHYMA
jgi:hypothetical protein